jgi:queuine tRNA-ribosyltransferase
MIEIIKKYSRNKARVTKIKTAHGEVITPAFMPVATRAFFNLLTLDDVRSMNHQIILGGNTFHMLRTPGMEIIKNSGGMHRFMNWDRAMLTDSGGYQVFSLSRNSEICKINESGAKFKDPETGRLIELTPAISIATQKIIGADIIMAFDHCTPEVGGREGAIAAMERTHRWLEISKEVHLSNPNSEYGYPQQLFGIVQGGSFRDLREESAKFIVSLGLDGVGIGGEAIGFDMKKTCEIVDWIEPLLPENQTRYAMGVGLDPQDLIDITAHGVDIFDCVAPTRNARHGTLYAGEVVDDGDWLTFKEQEKSGKLIIRKAIYSSDQRPILPGCECHTCKHYSRAYLRYLFKEDSSLYNNLACIHNVHMMEQVSQKIREKILRDE